MLKRFILYIINEKSGSYRELSVNAKNSTQARILSESLCLRNNERIVMIYPDEY